MSRRAARLVVALLPLVLLGCAGAPANVPVAAVAAARVVPDPAASEATILHVLQRLTYGPRPGDVARVQTIGLAAWLERQLDPSAGSTTPRRGRVAALRP